MANNSIPKAYEPLVELMVAATGGAHIHGAAIGLVHNTEAKIRADLEELIGRKGGTGGVPPATTGRKFDWDDAKVKRSAKIAALNVAIREGRRLARLCIGTLTPVLGESWNVKWEEVGLNNGSLAIPAEPQVLLHDLRAYYGLHPEHEVASVQGIACTAAACEAAAQVIQAVRTARSQSEIDAGLAQAAYNAAFAAASLRISHLRDELAQLIADDDERWLAFGFEKPADPSTPDVPANLVVTPAAAGSKTLVAVCEQARRATSYRFRAINTTDNQEVANHIVEATQTALTLTNLAAGTPVAITVSARNAKGESRPSAPVTATVP
jgi:hypothetical protein